MNALALALAALRGTPAVNHPQLCGPYANLLAAVVNEEKEKTIEELRKIYRRRAQEVVAHSEGTPEVTLSPAAKRLLTDIAWALEAPNVVHGGVLGLREALVTYDLTWSQS